MRPFKTLVEKIDLCTGNLFCFEVAVAHAQARQAGELVGVPLALCSPCLDELRAKISQVSDCILEVTPIKKDRLS